IDSGVWSEFTTGKIVDVAEYREWSERWRDRADAIAGVDDIRGDWRRSLKNYEAVPWGFPTFHETDPPELLPELCAMARERGGWIGFGLMPPRESKERLVRSVMDRMPDDLHVHFWAGRLYTYVRRVDSVDSTNWWRDAMKLRTLPDTAHLTYGECLQIVVKRYQRFRREIREPKNSGLPLLEELTA
ncbi:MAG TPA: hypothetical protein VJV74_11475, partial [Terriglobia bacterium]|nr:hypothetical protein [Terriglobia bacterium]